jgi:hypothetical protein
VGVVVGLLVAKVFDMGREVRKSSSMALASSRNSRAFSSKSSSLLLLLHTVFNVRRVLQVGVGIQAAVATA